MDELLAEFLVEGRELVQQAVGDLLALERDPANAARIDSAFRAVHTLKGSAGLFDFAPLGRALHAAEDVLGAARDGRRAVDRAMIDRLLACLDAGERWFSSIGQTGALPAGAAAESDRLAAALRQGAAPEGAPERAAQAAPDWLPGLLARQAAALRDAADGADGALVALRYVPLADCFFLGDDPLALLRGVPALRAVEIAPRGAWSAPFDPFTCNLVIMAISAAGAEAVRAAFRFVPDQVAIVPVPRGPAGGPALPPSAAPAGAGSAADEAGRFLRVDAGRIDALLDIVGELIVAKNGLAHVAARVAAQDPALGRALAERRAEIDRLMGDMQRAVMGVRMTRLARTFRRLPRLVRESAGTLGKTVDFAVSGEEIEADKTIVDGLFEPLLHVLRNAVDHGIEDAAGRAAAGKPSTGRVTLAAAREADRIVITVADDGAGIDGRKLRAAAEARGLLDAAALAAMDEAALAELVFLPGFSTAASVTAISGRGVGMDAVRAAVEALGGTVALRSTPGAGMMVRLSLPQAVLVTTIVTVRVGAQGFGVPIEAVAETARLPAGAIQRVRGGEAFVLRGRTVPLLRLGRLLGLEGTAADEARVLVVRAGEALVGVAVDAVGERIDVLLRPMAGLLAGTRGVQGAALMGDGSVLMVLDLADLIA